MKYLTLLILLLSISNPVHSEEIRYISDRVKIPLRSGETLQHRIRLFLNSGVAVTLIGISDEKQWSLIRTKKGTEGWVQSKYLSSTPSGRDLYVTANERAIELEKRNSALSQQLVELKDKLQQTEKNVSSLSVENQKLNKELSQIKEISANAIQLNSDNLQLSEQYQLLKNEVEVLNTDNKHLIDQQQNDSFLNGAFAVLIGVMITLLVPRFWPQKGTDWA